MIAERESEANYHPYSASEFVMCSVCLSTGVSHCLREKVTCGQDKDILLCFLKNHIEEKNFFY